MLRKIDDVIFDILPAVQTLVHRIEYVTLISQITQARVLVVFGTAYHMSLSYRAWLAGEWFGIVGMVGSFLLLVLCLVLLIPAAQSLYKRASGARNPLRVAAWMMIYRLSLLGGLCYKLYLEAVREDPIYSSAVMGVCLVLVAYIASCDNLPPGARFVDRFRKPIPV